MRRTFSFALLAVLATSLTFAQTKRTLKPDDYKLWETLSAPQISKDGHWLSYGINLVDGDGRLIVRNNDTPQIWTIANGAQAAFSDDSKWAAYLVSPPKAIADQLRDQKKPVERRLGLRNLTNGEEQAFDSVQGFSFMKGSKYLLLHRYRGATKPDGGSDLNVITLGTGEGLAVGNVVSYSANRDGTILALQIVSDSGYKGIQLLNPATGALKTLAWSKDDIGAMTWAEKADVLAFAMGSPDEKKEGNGNRIVVATNLEAAKPTLKSFDPSKRQNFPTGKRIAEFGGLRISEDGSAVAFGITDWKDKRKPDTTKPADKAQVEIWNSKDVRVMPQQKLNASGERLRTAQCVWRVDGDMFTQVNDGRLEGVSLFRNFDYALVTDPKPYQSSVTNGVGYQDVYLVNLSDGKRSKILAKSQWGASPSREGKYVVYFQGKNWWLYNVATGSVANVTGASKVSFANEDDDHTVPEKGPAGFPMWFSKDAGLLVSDDYDTWLVDPSMGRATRLTHGREKKRSYRYAFVERTDEGPRLDRPLYFSVRDEVEKGSGYFLSDGKGGGKDLFFDQVQIGNLTKAEDADRMIFVMNTFEKSPNVFITNGAFTQAKPQSNLNPQQAQFLWGRVELVKFKSRWGQDLQGTLIYPADYEAGKKYPMVTYIYEKLSDGLYNYITPVDWSAYNQQVFSQNGYFVFMPDIAYKGRNPGLSSVDCLEPGVDAVLAKNVGVDGSRVGLIGHSWGAYQTAFVTSVSKKFAVGACGAPLTELTSMYNSFYGNAGITNQILLETGQGRLEVPFWDDPKTYFDNSPVWQSKKRTTPILFAFGDKDGAVDWHQGQYLYNTLRRMGKPCVMLLYADENHNFTKRPDQLDYAKRLRHYLDVYLKGTKPEAWISDGVSYIDQTGG